MATNTLRIEKEICRRCPQGSCSGPGIWILQYNSLLKLKYMDRTKIVAFADYLLIETGEGSVKAVENAVNVELCKLNEWMWKNKTRFNDKKSKVILV